MDPDQDQDQSVKIDKPDPDPHQFADDKPKYMEYKHIWALFHGFKFLFGSWDHDPAPDPHQSKS